MSRIYYNGRIVTVEGGSAEEMLENEPEAVLVENGIITAVGSLDDCIDASPGTEETDLEGKCLMPSFIDPHGHFVMNGQMSLCAYLGNCESYDDIISVLKGYIRENKITSKDAVMGFGYDHNFLKEYEESGYGQPDKRVLDQVSTEIPIMILHVSGHLACVNSAMFKLAGVDRDTPDPSGGVIGRIEGTNEPSGYLEEGGMRPFSSLIGKRMKVDIPAMMSHMQDSYLENGVTTVQDGGSGKQDIDTLKMMSKEHLLKIDVVAYPIMPDGGTDIMKEDGEKYKDYRNHFKIGGYKLILDGSPQGRSAWMSEPYFGGEEGYCGYPWMQDDAVERFVQQAYEEKKQLLVHCNGDAASEQCLNAYEKAVNKAVEACGCAEDLRPVMIHCQTVRNDQLDRMAKLKMIASIFVGHVWYWGDVHMKNFGEKRGSRISPVKDALDRGLVVNFHQDSPVTKPDMLHSIWCAVNRVSRSGKTIGSDQKVSVFDAVKAATLGGAYEYFEENSKGSIKAGKRADLVILDKSPFDVEPEEIKDIEVLETIKDGETVYERKAVNTEGRCMNAK